MSRLIDADYVLKALGIFNDRQNGNEHYLNGIETAREIVQDAPTIGGWVSVKDRMPEENVPVLVWELQGFAYVDIYKDGAWRIGTPELAKLTHWMPIPEPPKEVSK